MFLWRLRVHFLDIRYPIYHSLEPGDIFCAALFPSPFGEEFYSENY